MATATRAGHSWSVSPTSDPGYRSGLVALDDLVVSNRSGLPAGRYRVYFGIDVASSAFADLERGNFDTLVLDVAE